MLLCNHDIWQQRLPDNVGRVHSIDYYGKEASASPSMMHDSTYVDEHGLRCDEAWCN